MRQKVAICCGYLHQPRVFLLDEPLTGLDPHGIRTMKESIRAHAAAGTAFIVSSHLLSLIEDLCTSVLILHRGRQVLHRQLAELRREALEAGRHESLEDLFFRLTAASEGSGVGSQSQGQESGVRSQESGSGSGGGVRRMRTEESGLGGSR
jgi:ABC-2 type transport system ATP-binding protein